MINLSLPPFEMLVRFAAALLAGSILGLERQSRGKPSGLRTYILVCGAASLAMIVTTASSTTFSLDPGRVAQGLLAGMGFLGAGTILRLGPSVRGLTTAAGLWFATILGIVFGSGNFILGGVGFVCAFVVMEVLPHLEWHLDVEHEATLTVTLPLDGTAADQIRSSVEALGPRVRREELSYDVQAGQKTLQYDVSYRTHGSDRYPQKIVDKLLGYEGVQQVKWTQQV